MHRLVIISLLILNLAFFSCKEEKETPIDSQLSKTTESLEVKYATGFDLYKTTNGYRLQVNNPYPGSSDTLQLEVSRDIRVGSIRIPIEKLIATSTTHIPPLVLLDETHKLIGFPDTDYISSAEMRSRIDLEFVEDLGANESINLERTISLQPDLVMGYSINAENPTYQSIIDAGIPVLYNGDWNEQHPLGRAEWIKVFGILFDKEKEAFELFNQIESDYLAAKNSVAALEKPTVIAGATWKDVWYLPYGNSWQGTMIKDAGGDYIYKDTNGSGSLAYNIETVLKDAQQADYWIAPGQYTSYSQMLADNDSYKLFEAFKNKQLYTFALKKGATGGVIYYEEASMRPDLVLKDLIEILHGDATAENLYFFDPLKP